MTQTECRALLPLPAKCTLSATAIKWLALVLMTLDHVGMIFYMIPCAAAFRAAGRVAFPLFAYIVGESCRYTRHRFRFLAVLTGAGIVMQVVYTAVMGDWYLNIFLTFAMAAADAFAFFAAREHKGAARAWFAVLFAALLCAEFAASYLWTFIGMPYFKLVQYELPGILLAVAVALLPNRVSRFSGFGVCLFALCLSEQLLWGITFEWWAMLALVPLLFYNGTRGAHPMKWFFYIYYPANVVLLEGLYMLIFQKF